MGSFSWYKADKKDNMVYGDTVKMLIPQEFGGGLHFRNIRRLWRY